jgi:hypothetical protein
LLLCQNNAALPCSVEDAVFLHDAMFQDVVVLHDAMFMDAATLTFA